MQGASDQADSRAEPVHRRTKRQLADAASVRPNTLTNLIKHGRDSDTATLARIAAALHVDIAELFLTREQSLILYAHRESRIDRLKDLVVKELSDTVTKLVTQELERGGNFSPEELTSLQEDKALSKRPPRRRLRAAPQGRPARNPNTKPEA